MATNTLPQLLILYMVFTLKEPIILSHKRSLDTEKLRSNKLNECLRCKVLTDSFSTWLDRTSRGKHEGGDAAWEEAKLKSYSRSEMRLVEIQEGLCSELKIHKDHCYALADKAEQLLEQWWLKENYDNADIYTWLCIENLQYCCPVYHFGEMCTPCPRDKNNEICGGKGKCDGDGTRKGNGTCICKKGYSGNNCEECATNFYKTLNACKPCHRACSECHNDGPSACVQCASGWTMESGVCVDINECLNESFCTASEFCVNTAGSYTCKSCYKSCRTCVGPGSKECTSCKPDYVLWVGKCMSKDHQKNLLNNAFKRAACYLCLFIIVMVILRKSKSLASFVALLIALGIYFYENTSDIKLIDLYKLYYEDVF
ncbi:protein disulfide isomerase CRELD1-like [Maniola jurtina]|uniref:protein disulfide isomerase CRELD1-like n=1 Tax=Maniola jurtina TaxID=191418 RepID=UPI001E68CA5B|nr:protein disulfide isomerase CRELD1-like [Maniola jurtina]